MYRMNKKQCALKTLKDLGSSILSAVKNLSKYYKSPSFIDQNRQMCSTNSYIFLHILNVLDLFVTSSDCSCSFMSYPSFKASTNHRIRSWEIIGELERDRCMQREIERYTPGRLYFNLNSTGRLLIWVHFISQSFSRTDIFSQ